MFDLPMFTLVHVVISVLGIIAGLVVVGGLLAGARLERWTLFFFATTLLTSLTGFGFPSVEIGPPHIVGALSLAVLALGLAARYWMRLRGTWRAIYVVACVTALYLDLFVLIVQLFVKTPPLAQLAPTQQEAPFALTQGLLLVLFLGLGRAALRAFRAEKAVA